MTRRFALLLSLLLSVAAVRAQGTLTFNFSGFIEFNTDGNVPGLSIGDQFFGSFTFDPLTLGAPQTPYDTTLDTEYWALTSWNVTLPGSSITLGGPHGEIAVGNDTPQWFFGDRYIVTMFADSNGPPLKIGGHELRLFQIDLQDFGMGAGDMLQDSSLPVTPPDLALVPRNGRLGRFFFTDASYQNQMTSFTAVPEPSSLAFTAVSMVAFCSVAKRRRSGRRTNGNSRHASPDFRSDD